jgi:hypothetical protein
MSPAISSCQHVLEASPVEVTCWDEVSWADHWWEALPVEHDPLRDGRDRILRLIQRRQLRPNGIVCEGHGEVTSQMKARKKYRVLGCRWTPRRRQQKLELQKQVK